MRIWAFEKGCTGLDLLHLTMQSHKARSGYGRPIHVSYATAFSKCHTTIAFARRNMPTAWAYGFQIVEFRQSTKLFVFEQKSVRFRYSCSTPIQTFSKAHIAIPFVSSLRGLRLLL